MSVATAASINLDVGAAAPLNDSTGLAAAIVGGTVLCHWAAGHGSDPGGTSNDLLKVGGTLTLGGTGASGSVVVVNAAALSYLNSATFGDYFNLLDWSGALAGSFTTGLGPQQGVGGTFQGPPRSGACPTLTDGNFWGRKPVPWRPESSSWFRNRAMPC